MKRLTAKERIEALKLVQEFGLIVTRAWWDWTCPVRWVLRGTGQNITEDQYSYLTNNKLVNAEHINADTVQLTISREGKLRLALLTKDTVK